MKINIINSLFILAGSIFLISIFAGCGSVSQESVLLQNIENARMNSAEVRIRLNDIATRYCLNIENTADKIIAKAENVRAKQNALLWKMYGIPALIKSLSIRDPIAAGTDIWVLIAQMHQFFESGNGRDLFGSQQKIAVDAVKNMESDFINLAAIFNKDSAMVTKSKVDTWIAEHPIEDIMFNRISTVTVRAQELSRKQLDFSSSIGDMVTSVNNLEDRLILYADFMPKQARWQAEYLIYELMPDSLKDKPFESLGSMAASIERISRTIEGSPELISSLQEKMMRDINEQRILTIESLQEERKIILEMIMSERSNVMKEIDRQRLAALDNVSLLTDKSIKSSGDMLVDAADRILIRLIVLIFVGIILLIVYSRYLKPGLEKKK
jgi:hypothetical protein